MLFLLPPQQKLAEATSSLKLQLSRLQESVVSSPERLRDHMSQMKENLEAFGQQLRDVQEKMTSNERKVDSLDRYDVDLRSCIKLLDDWEVDIAKLKDARAVHAQHQNQHDRLEEQLADVQTNIAMQRSKLEHAKDALERFAQKTDEKRRAMREREAGLKDTHVRLLAKKNDVAQQAAEVTRKAVQVEEEVSRGATLRLEEEPTADPSNVLDCRFGPCTPTCTRSSRSHSWRTTRSGLKLVSAGLYSLLLQRVLTFLIRRFQSSTASSSTTVSTRSTERTAGRSTSSRLFCLILYILLFVLLPLACLIHYVVLSHCPTCVPREGPFCAARKQTPEGSISSAVYNRTFCFPCEQSSRVVYATVPLKIQLSNMASAAFGWSYGRKWPASLMMAYDSRPAERNSPACLLACLSSRDR